MKLNKKQTEDLRGMFFIVKGQYRKGVEPSFINEVSNNTTYIGGYDPSRKDTSEWYMVLDRITFNCVCCGSDFERAKRSVYSAIKKYKTKDRYLKELEKRDPRNKVSYPMKELYKHIYNTYGDYYIDEIEEQEDLAYSDVVFKTPLQRSKDTMKKTSVKRLVTHKTPKEEVKREEKSVIKMRKTPPKKMAIRKLSI